MKALKWVSFRRMLKLLSLFLGLIAARSAVNAQIPAQELEALQPLMCGSCLVTSDIKIYEVTNDVGILSPAGLYLSSFLKDKGGRPATPDDLRSPGLQSKLRFATRDPAKRASTRHVCLGSRIAMAPNTVGVDTPVPQVEWTKVTAHPDAIDGVCIGELRSIEIFLQTVMAGIFADQLAKAEKRTAPEAVNEAIRGNLADVLAEHKVQLVRQIKGEVIAELRPKQTAPAVPDPAASAPKPEACTTGVFSCQGKSYKSCCMCAGTAGVPNRKGVCDASGTPGSWRPSP